MKIIMMGTGPFALPTFQWLVESEHEVPLLVTRPIDDAGRRRKTLANPMRSFAESLPDIGIFDPPDINDAAAIERIASAGADLLAVCDYGQILANQVLAAAPLGGINLHGSLLPAWRGAAPINWAIFHGDTETGVTVIHMTPKLDGGPILIQKTIDIGPQETAEQLEPRMAELGVSAVAEAITMLESWDGRSDMGRPQGGPVTKAPRLKKQQGAINWQTSARQIHNQIRAFQPWPGSFTHWLPASGKPVRLIVQRARVHDQPVESRPGTVCRVTDAGIFLATRDGLLELVQIQPAGKRSMPVSEFLRGRGVAEGDRFGNLET